MFLTLTFLKAKISVPAFRRRGHLFLLFDSPSCPPQEACQAPKHLSFCQWLPGPPPSCGHPFRTPSSTFWPPGGMLPGSQSLSERSHRPLVHVLQMVRATQPGVCPRVGCSDVHCLGPESPVQHRPGPPVGREQPDVPRLPSFHVRHSRSVHGSRQRRQAPASPGPGFVPQAWEGEGKGIQNVWEPGLRRPRPTRGGHSSRLGKGFNKASVLWA